MTDASENEVRRIEDRPPVGKADVGGQPQRHTVRAFFRTLLPSPPVRERALRFWNALCGLTLSLSAMIAVIVVSTLLVQELTRRTLAIEPISVPKELADKGYAPDVAARRMKDAVNTFVARARTSTKGPEIALRGDVPDIVVPTVGISVDNIATALRGILHSDRHRSISGEFTVADGLLWLRLRLNGRQIYSSKTGGAPERPDELLAAAVPQLFKEVQPFIAAAYLYNYQRDSAQALRILQKTVATPKPDDTVVNSYDLKSWILRGRKDYGEATLAARQAILIKSTICIRP